MAESYRTDDLELALEQRRALIQAHQREREEVMRSLGESYAHRMARIWFSRFMSLLFLGAAGVALWIGFSFRQPWMSGQMISARPIASGYLLFLALLVSGLLFLSYELSRKLAQQSLLRRLSKHCTPTKDLYHDLARLSERPYRLVQEELAAISVKSIREPLVLLSIFLPLFFSSLVFSGGIFAFYQRLSDGGSLLFAGLFFGCSLLLQVGLVHHMDTFGKTLFSGKFLSAGRNPKTNLPYLPKPTWNPGMTLALGFLLLLLSAALLEHILGAQAFVEVRGVFWSMGFLFVFLTFLYEVSISWWLERCFEEEQEAIRWAELNQDNSPR